jgi:uncharacterized protein
MTTSLASEPWPQCTGGGGGDLPVWAVLDTNVVLDMLLFKDIRLNPLHSALVRKALVWVATDPMLDELSHVLQRRSLARWGHDPHQILAEALGLCCKVMPCTEVDTQVPRCTDSDDQIFIDLAWRWPTSWLFSRDRALLRLARKAKPHGLWIGPPEHWQAQQATSVHEKRQPELPF